MNNKKTIRTEKDYKIRCNILAECLDDMDKYNKYLDGARNICIDKVYSKVKEVEKELFLSY